MPKVSVVILNWNGKEFLDGCLSTLRELRYKPLEVILVDNNSSDGSADYIAKKFPWVKLIRNTYNSGFAEGNNIGYKNSTGKYILFLNNDTKVTADFLTVLVKELESDRSIGCIQPQMRIMNSPDLQDEAGGYLTQGGFLYHYGYRKKYSRPVYKCKREVFSVKGACMLIPRRILEEVGLFDPDFFIFFEETDLCYRIWLAGYKVIYDPKSYIFHFVGGDTVSKYSYERRIYLTFKNMTCSYLKNFGLKNFFSVYPLFLGIQSLLAIYYLITFKWYLLRAIAGAYAWNIHNLGQTMVKRRQIQHGLRRISDSDLDKHIISNPKFSYLYYSFSNTKFYQDQPVHTAVK